LNNWIFDTYTQQHESYARLLSEREETEAEREQVEIIPPSEITSNKGRSRDGERA
jgi:hypothetical protein